MELTDKYELLESLTGGAVETFVANDKGRGERVLVHFLHCEPQRPNQPTVQWVLENFRKAAPEPAGLVLETGKYGGTLYAYIVTKLPDEAALKSWVDQYKSQRADTREIPVQVAKQEPKADTPANDHSTAEIPTQQPAQVPVQFTQVFRGFDPQRAPAPPIASTKEPESPLRPVPSLDDPGHPSGLQAAPNWDAMVTEKPIPPKADPIFHKVEPLSPTMEPPASVPDANSPESSFSKEFAVNRFPTEMTAPAIKDTAKPGEFTSFFQGPFRPDAPAEVPIPSSPIESRPKSPGGFTEMFGAVTSQPDPPLVSSVPEKKSGPGTGFTGWFSDPDILSRTPEAPSPGRSGMGNDAASVFPAPSKEPVLAKPAPPPPPVVAAPPVFPTPTPVATKPPAMPTPSSPDGATRAFSVPSVEPAHVQPVPISGPSPYTQVISMRAMAEADAAAFESGKTPAAASSPKMPELKAPEIKAPAMPKPPAMPKVPAPPKLKMLKAEAPKPPVSFWPLVITLTVLFCVAVLLVLFFVLKH